MKTTKRTINSKAYKVESGLARDIRSADDGRGAYSSTYVQVNLDKLRGEIWGDLHCSIGQNSWIEYHRPNIFVLGLYADKNFKLSDLSDALEKAEEEEK